MTLAPGATATEADALAATGAAATPSQEAKKVDGRLRGCYVLTPYGWGICNGDDESSPHVQVALDWHLAGIQRVQSAVRRSDITGSSFCAVGQCVLTTFGTGVLLGFRPGDGIHHVQLWGRPSQGKNHAFLQREALLAVLPAAAGLAVETPDGPGICRGYRPATPCGRGGEPRAAGATAAAAGDKAGEGHAALVQAVVSTGEFVVELPSGIAVFGPGSVRCPVALVLPLVDRFLTRAADLFKLHFSTLARLRDALQGLGLEKLRERLTASAGEAMEVASKLWEEWEDKGGPDGLSVFENLKLKADEVLADPEMKEAFSAGIARLNCLVCRAEGFDGVWVGRADHTPRCVIKDAMIIWHWGEESELEIWSHDSVSTLLQEEIFRGSLLPDGSLEWTDGDAWVREGGQPQGGAASPAAEEAGGRSPGGSSLRSNLALIQRSLGDLRRIVNGSGVEGDVEEALGALQKLASSDAEVQRVVEEMTKRRELILDLRGQVLQSKTGQVLQEGQQRLADKLQKLQETAITPQLERMQNRSQRFLTRLATDKKVQGKAAELVSAAQSRITERLADPNDPHRSSLEAWVTSVKDRVVGQLGVHRAMLAESLGGLNLEQLDIRQLVANSWDPATLEEQLERSLLQALELSGVRSSGTELLDRFESAEHVAQIPVLRRTYQGVLSALADLNIEVPVPIRKLLEAQAAGCAHDASAWKEAIVSSLDDDGVVNGAEELVKKGEEMLSQFQDLKGMNTVAKVFEHFENEDIEREVLRRLHGVDPSEMLRRAESALTSAEARDALVSQLKDTCLDFVLKILPAINIEKVSGNDNGCDWEISDISFSDFSFRKENVHLHLGKPGDGQELLRVSAWDISAHFKRLKVAVKQTGFPFMEGSGIADAKAERMRVQFGFKLDPGAVNEGGRPALVMSSRAVHMENLELWVYADEDARLGQQVAQATVAAIINPLSYLFANVLKDYACQKIASHLDEHLGSLVGALNTLLENCKPLLEKIGLALPIFGDGASSPDTGEPDEPAGAPSPSAMKVLGSAGLQQPALAAMSSPPPFRPPPRRAAGPGGPPAPPPPLLAAASAALGPSVVQDGSMLPQSSLIPAPKRLRPPAPGSGSSPPSASDAAAAAAAAAKAAAAALAVAGGAPAVRPMRASPPGPQDYDLL